MPEENDDFVGSMRPAQALRGSAKAILLLRVRKKYVF